VDHPGNEEELAMRTNKPILLAAAVLMAAGCSDVPTEPTAADALFDAGKSPNKGMELIWVSDYPEPEGYLDYIPCFNGGEGETVLAFGHLEFWARTVETPSGNYHEHGEYRGFEHYRGQETGDLWLSLSFTVPTIFYHTRSSDGTTTINEPVWIYSQNQRTGETVRMKWNFHVVYDRDGNFLRYDAKVTNCMPWKGQIH
jgi:hypothetical protein